MYIQLSSSDTKNLQILILRNFTCSVAKTCVVRNCIQCGIKSSQFTSPINLTTTQLAVTDDYCGSFDNSGYYIFSYWEDVEIGPIFISGFCTPFPEKGNMVISQYIPVTNESEIIGVGVSVSILAKIC